MLPSVFKLRASLIVLCVCSAVSISAAPCVRNEAQREEWISLQVNVLVRAAHAAYLNDRAESAYNRTVKLIARQFERCNLAGDPQFAGAYPEFVQYLQLLSLAQKDDHELGFEVSDREYFAETNQYTGIPDFLLTSDFLRAVSRFETLSAAKTLLREINRGRAGDRQLTFFSYRSRHLGTPDNLESYWRLLIVVPGDAARHIPEKWVQFGIADPGRPTSVRNVSVVAVLPRDDRTVNVYFKDYYRTYRRDGSITLAGRWELGEGDDDCVTCHKSGVLPIFPVAGSVHREEQPQLDAVNERFRNYGTARFGRYLDTTKFGPGIGSSAPRQNFRRASFASVDTGSNVRSCASCHHANGLGALSWPMNETLISSFVEGGKMPFGADLSRGARSQLYNALVDNYFRVNRSQPGILQAWLLGRYR
jgi:hypothetical protein